MARRPPITEELKARIESVLLIASLLLYVAGSYAVFKVAALWIRDPVNLQTLASVVWLPCGIFALWAKGWAADYLFRYVDHHDTPED